MVININHRYILDIPNNISPVLPYDIDTLHDNYSSSFTLFVDISDFDLYQTELVNVESMTVDESVQRVDLTDNNEVQHDDTLEDYMDNEEDNEYEFDDETSESETENLYIDTNDSYE